MWTWTYADAGNVPRMNHGLNKAVHHAASLGVGDPLLSRLKALQAAHVGKQNLTPAEKSALVHELDEIIGEIGKLATQNQSDFKSDPERPANSHL